MGATHILKFEPYQKRCLLYPMSSINSEGMSPPSDPPPEEWDFSSVSEEELKICCLHEYRRERPDGPNAGFLLSTVFGDALLTPFLKLPAGTRKSVNGGLPPRPQSFDFGTISDLLILLDENLDKTELQMLGAMLLKRSGTPAPEIPTGDKRANNRIYWNVLERKLKKASDNETALRLFLRIDNRKASPTDLKDRFGKLINSMPQSRFERPRGEKRGAQNTRFRQALRNLAIMRLRHRLPLTEATKIYQSSYLAKEFCDSEGGDFFHSKADVIKRVDERRSSAIESFRKLNRDLGPDAKPLSSEFFSGIS